MNNAHPLVLFGIAGSEAYADKIAEKFTSTQPQSWQPAKRSEHVEKHFGDGESYLKSKVNVRDADVYVVCSLHTDDALRVNEKLVDLLWFIGSLRDASAHRITAVIPYMGYARQDRKTESRAPITTKYMAQVLESVGVNRVLTMDVHSLAAFQNSFRIPVDNLDTTRLFVDHLTELLHPFPTSDLVVLSPDIGGMTRCGLIQRALSKRVAEMLDVPPTEIPLAIFDKRRVDGEVEGSRIIGNVMGKKVLIFDDLIASGTTIAKAAEAAVKAGGEIYAVCATHGQFTDWGVIENLLGLNGQKQLAKRLIVTDSIKQANDFSGRLTVIDTSHFLADAVKRTHSGGSISDLLTV
jgi:ribose-phosphate pyrophosphokinase